MDVDGDAAVYIHGYDRHGTDVSEHAIARPEYSAVYLDALARFNAVLARVDCSRDALSTIDPVLAECGAHYTAWRHRARCVEHLVQAATSDADARAVLEEEFAYVEAKTVAAPKNYQVWNHARVVIGSFDANDKIVIARAFAHVDAALALDAKNIHAWTHRAWCVARFQATRSWKEELEYTAAVLRDDDWWNNSAWNARFHAVEIGTRVGLAGSSDVVQDITTRELAFVKESLQGADDNESAWNYLRGINTLTNEYVMDTTDDSYKDNLADASLLLAREFAYAKPPNRHAMLFVADALAMNAQRTTDAKLIADAKATFNALMTIDPVRVNYYVARINRLETAVRLELAYPERWPEPNTAATT
jgi:protein farnesyltransferase/geranylgeranyltransferase type-1 subunit alpha